VSEKLSRAQVEDNAIGPDQLDVDAVNGDHIQQHTVTADHIADSVSGSILTWDASGRATAVAPGAAGTVITSNGPGAGASFQPIIANPVQSVRVESVGHSTLSGTAIPYDDTIPQVTEGNLLFTSAFTPTSTDNLLEFHINVSVYVNSGAQVAISLHKDGAANAVAVEPQSVAGGIIQTINVRFLLPATTTSEETWTVRIGTGAAHTMYVNGNNAGRRYGGLVKSYFEIREVLS
jgi:hypothetical protein